MLKELEQARQEKFIGSGARSKGTALGERRGCSAARPVSPGTARTSSSSRRSHCSRAGEAAIVTVEHADGKKCERCWKYTNDVGSRPDIHAGICAECSVRWNDSCSELTRSVTGDCCWNLCSRPRHQGVDREYACRCRTAITLFPASSTLSIRRTTAPLSECLRKATSVPDRCC